MHEDPISNASEPMGFSRDANQWGMFIHFSQFAGFVIPIAGLIVPIILWQIKKDEYPIVDQHGKNVANWIISCVIYFVVCGILSLILIGLLGFALLVLLEIIFAIIGGIKANNGEVWEYPLSIRFIK